MGVSSQQGAVSGTVVFTVPFTMVRVLGKILVACYKYRAKNKISYHTTSVIDFATAAA